jgi:predicted RNA-binding Zn-ribbon protein involved in translation (DUF1610 family)
MSELKTILTCVVCGYTIRNPKTNNKTCPKCGGTLIRRVIKPKKGKTCQQKPTSH